MPDFRDIKKRFDEIREAVKAQLPTIATQLTLSAKALAERRIKDQGFGEMYSINKIPAWFLHGKELNKGGSTFLEGLSKKGIKLTNWGEFRAAQGLPTDHVDLSYTNKMWANMQPQEPTEENGIVSAPLAATNAEAQNKMNWNKERYGDFIGRALLPEDFGTLSEFVAGEIISILETFE